MTKGEIRALDTKARDAERFAAWEMSKAIEALADGDTVRYDAAIAEMNRLMKLSAERKQQVRAILGELA